MNVQAFDVDNKTGRYALERVYQDICGVTSGPMPDVMVRNVVSSLRWIRICALLVLSWASFRLRSLSLRMLQR